MNKFDQFVKHRLKVKYYARYTDDFVIVADNADYLNRLLPSIKSFLKKKLLIELHPKKVEVRRCTRGIDFLGYVVLPYYIRLRNKTKRRMLRKLRIQVEQYKHGDISDGKLQAALQSYLGVLSHADEFQLSEHLKNMFWW